MLPKLSRKKLKKASRKTYHGRKSKKQSRTVRLRSLSSPETIQNSIIQQKKWASEYNYMKIGTEIIFLWGDNNAILGEVVDSRIELPWKLNPISGEPVGSNSVFWCYPYDITVRILTDFIRNWDEFQSVYRCRCHKHFTYVRILLCDLGINCAPVIYVKHYKNDLLIPLYKIAQEAIETYNLAKSTKIFRTEICEAGLKCRNRNPKHLISNVHE